MNTIKRSETFTAALEVTAGNPLSVASMSASLRSAQGGLIWGSSIPLDVVFVPSVGSTPDRWLFTFQDTGILGIGTYQLDAKFTVGTGEIITDPILLEVIEASSSIDLNVALPTGTPYINSTPEAATEPLELQWYIKTSSVTGITAAIVGPPGPAVNESIPDGDKGDIITSDSGTTWLIKPAVLSNFVLIADLNTREPIITSGTTAQYWRGDKSWQTLGKASVGLSNVDNTSDANKPISTAQATVNITKADSNHTHIIASVTGLQAALDSKPDSNHTHIIASVTGLQAALDSKQISLGYTPTSITSLTGIQTLAAIKTALSLVKADVGLGNVDNTSDANKPISTAQATVNAAKADLVEGVIPTSQIPAQAITEFLGDVTSQAAMLALVGQRGDWCIRTDVNRTYFLIADTASVLGNWRYMETPASPVTSVNSQTGVITLGKTDVGLGNIDNTSDANKPLSSAEVTALSGKQPLATALTNTTASFTTALETKLSGIATGATVYTDENARDAIAAALVAGAGMIITPNDAADTITLAAKGNVVFVGPSAPVSPPATYLWIQTQLGAGTDISFWIEDGL